MKKRARYTNFNFLLLLLLENYQQQKGLWYVTVVTFIHRWKYGFACRFDR